MAPKAGPLPICAPCACRLVRFQLIPRCACEHLSFACIAAQTDDRSQLHPMCVPNDVQSRMLRCTCRHLPFDLTAVKAEGCASSASAQVPLVCSISMPVWSLWLKCCAASNAGVCVQAPAVRLHGIKSRGPRSPALARAPHASLSAAIDMQAQAVHLHGSKDTFLLLAVPDKYQMMCSIKCRGVHAGTCRSTTWHRRQRAVLTSISRGPPCSTSLPHLHTPCSPSASSSSGLICPARTPMWTTGLPPGPPMPALCQLVETLQTWIRWVQSQEARGRGASRARTRSDGAPLLVIGSEVSLPCDDEHADGAAALGSWSVLRGAHLLPEFAKLMPFSAEGLHRV